MSKNRGRLGGQVTKKFFSKVYYNISWCSHIHQHHYEYYMRVYIHSGYQLADMQCWYCTIPPQSCADRGLKRCHPNMQRVRQCTVYHYIVLDKTIAGLCQIEHSLGQLPHLSTIPDNVVVRQVKYVSWFLPTTLIQTPGSQINMS